MPRQSAGLLMYRLPPAAAPELEVFLVHPGGPFWARKDEGAWTIPKGEYDDTEDPLAAAQREFIEETGFPVAGPFLPLGEITQKNRKRVTAWAFAGDCDPTRLVSNTCTVEWPPRSGRRIEIPEVDRGQWFSPAEARQSLRAEQHPLLATLESALAR
jgi:predicted NUDIX family NTP pyrophosphohydrolase